MFEQVGGVVTLSGALLLDTKIVPFHNALYRPTFPIIVSV